MDCIDGLEDVMDLGGGDDRLEDVDGKFLDGDGWDNILLDEFRFVCTLVGGRNVGSLLAAGVVL